MKNERGVTLPELLVGMAIMTIVTAAFTGLLKYSMITTTKAMNTGMASEDLRRGLSLVEESLLHANEVRVASSSFVEFTADLDRAPAYAREGDPDGDGLPNWRDGDTDNDASLLMAATAQWRVGFNLKDDDEDSDGSIDVLHRLYLAGKELRLDTSVNQDAWGSRVRTLMTNVSTFTVTYYGSKGNSLGRNIDQNNDGVITSWEMDYVLPATGMGNRNGALDLANERRYITHFRLYIGVDRNNDGKNENEVETDVYPPLLPLKSR